MFTSARGTLTWLRDNRQLTSSFLSTSKNALGSEGTLSDSRSSEDGLSGEQREGKDVDGAEHGDGTEQK